MRFVIQRVKNASVEVDGNIVGEINSGFLVLVGITHSDTEEIANKMVKKLVNLRVFEDENGKMNKSIVDSGGELLMVSQFTLYADCSHGNRPSFINASRPEHAEPLYEYVKQICKENGMRVEAGIFGADMKVSLINDGPVTIVLDSDDLK